MWDRVASLTASGRPHAKGHRIVTRTVRLAGSKGNEGLHPTKGSGEEDSALRKVALGRTLAFLSGNRW